jgi:cellulose synthase/poly-beta-1,6-N-acetylglucosamine synthase-like glycosyltransferase
MSTFVPALRRQDRFAVRVLTVGWVACIVAFWWWWLQPAHRTDWAALVLNSLLLLYISVTPAYFFLAIHRLRRVNPALEIPRLRVAFAVTRAPSEQWSVARTTLTAMLAQRFPYPYDVWLCDEDPDDRVLTWCEAHEVQVSCRRGVAAYHRTAWPRRTRCKEGNFAYFYDHWGYEQYDVVAQLDCDHVPEPDYLAEMLRPFGDPAIGYVAAPSVCDANAKLSWSARGRLYREASWHGAIQAGHNSGMAPVCIGSHYAVRTRALREVGGLGPELAEDFSTTLLLVSAGWHGAFAIEAEAHGDGPLTFADMLTQEFQWSRSLTTMLYDLLPHHLRRMPRGLRLRFRFAVAYYPVLALTTATGLALPPLAVASSLPWMSINYFEFAGRMASLAVWPLALTLMLRRRGLLRPRRAPLVSWESALFVLARWPYVAWGVVAATLQTIRPRLVTFKVTPKQRNGLEPLRLRVVAPYLFLTLTLSAAARYGELYTTQAGYVFLCILGAACYAAMSLAVPALHAVESARADGISRRDAASTARVPLLAGVAAAVPLGMAAAAYPAYAIAAFGW